MLCNRSILREKCTSFFTTSSMVLVFDSTYLYKVGIEQNYTRIVEQVSSW